MFPRWLKPSLGAGLTTTTLDFCALVESYLLWGSPPLYLNIKKEKRKSFIFIRSSPPLHSVSQRTNRLSGGGGTEGEAIKKRTKQASLPPAPVSSLRQR